MMNEHIKIFVWSFFALLILVFLTTFDEGRKLFKKDSFIESNQLEGEISSFFDMLGPSKLNPLNIEKAKEQIIVTQEEIEEHRYRYGSLSEQVGNILDQYEPRIEEAKSVGNEKLVESLTAERDAKSQDIQANFESDQYIEDKIRKMKEAILEQYHAGMKQYTPSHIPFAYKLKDVKTGEVYEQGNVNEAAIFKRKYSSEAGYYLASSGVNNGSGIMHEVIHDVSEVSSNRDAAMIEDWDEERITSYENPVRSFEGTVIIPTSAISSGFLGEAYKEHKLQTYAMGVLWGISLLSVLLLFKFYKFRKEWVTENPLRFYYGKLKMDVQIVLLVIVTFFTYSFISQLGYAFQHLFLRNYGVVFWILFVQACLITVGIALITFQVVYIVDRWKKPGLFVYDLKCSYVVSFGIALRDMFLKRTVGMQLFYLLIGFFLAGFGLFVVFVMPFALLIYIPCVLFLGIPALYFFVKRGAYLNRIFMATEAMAAGKLNEEIAVEGKSVLAQHAQNLNNLREGVRMSMSEQAKSERLKTELITNVSHDLRTPLTSIITYTDLLKNDKITDEERTKYVAIIEQKSARLKTLIEDLFEVSKMASGNLELNKQFVDLTQLLQQALAEHEEQISAHHLDFRVEYPETELIALIDGQRWWRVLDNLIVNAVKYSLTGTRVYVSLRKVNNQAEFVVKNITKYELDENVDELFERFKRADTSRQTEGSGLGLAIAQSIIDMHHGKMRLEVDGDLFKVTVLLPLA